MATTKESTMLNRVANIFTFLTFGLLVLCAGILAAAVHDFNSLGNNIFVREFEGHAGYQAGGAAGDLVGYQVIYIACGRPTVPVEGLNFTNGLLESSGIQYATIEKKSSPSRNIVRSFRPMERKQAFEQGLPRRDDFQLIVDNGLSTRRVCQINPAGLVNASRRLVDALI